MPKPNPGKGSRMGRGRLAFRAGQALSRGISRIRRGISRVRAAFG